MSRDLEKELDELKEMIGRLTGDIPRTVATPDEMQQRINEQERRGEEVPAIVKDTVARMQYKPPPMYGGIFESRGGNVVITPPHPEMVKLRERWDEAVKGSRADSVLPCFNSADKMNVLVLLMQKPHTVAELMETGKFGSTGQIHHIIKQLLIAGLATHVRFGAEQNPPSTSTYYIANRDKTVELYAFVDAVIKLIDPAGAYTDDWFKKNYGKSAEEIANAVETMD